MHDELVYALIGLGLHWWMGWRAMRKLRREIKDWGTDTEVSAIIIVFFGGIFVYPLLMVINYYENHDSIFGKGDNDED